MLLVVSNIIFLMATDIVRKIVVFQNMQIDGKYSRQTHILYAGTYCVSIKLTQFFLSLALIIIQ